MRMCAMAPASNGLWYVLYTTGIEGRTTGDGIFRPPTT
jgi:hypothetical protein